jgi:hypothetical protein
MYASFDYWVYRGWQVSSFVVRVTAGHPFREINGIRFVKCNRIAREKVGHNHEIPVGC